MQISAVSPVLRSSAPFFSLPALLLGLFIAVSSASVNAMGDSGAGKHAVDTAPSSVVLHHIDGYVRAMPPGHPVTAGFFRVHNGGDSVRISGASSEQAQRVEIHEHRHEQGMMRMRQVQSIALAADDVLVFKPGAYHLMIFGLDKSLAIGDSVTVSLHIDDEAGAPVHKVELLLPIQRDPMAGKASEHSGHKHHHHHAH